MSIEGGIPGNQRRLVCPNCGKVFFAWRPDTRPGVKVKCYYCRHEFEDEAARRAPEPAAAAAPGTPPLEPTAASAPGTPTPESTATAAPGTPAPEPTAAAAPGTAAPEVPPA